MSEEKELANLLHKRRKGETTERNKDLRLVGSTLLQEVKALRCYWLSICQQSIEKRPCFFSSSVFGWALLGQD